MDKRKIFSNFRNFDWLLFVAAFLLSLFGLISIISTTSPGDTFFSYVSISQGIFILLGIIICFWLSYIEYRSIQSFAIIIFAISLLLLILVLFFGETRNGTTAWFNLGLFSFQPSELAKLSMIIMLSFYFSKRSVHSLKQVFFSLIYLIIPLVLVLLEPDFGTSLAYILIWFCIILSLNLRKKEILLVIGSGLLLVVLMIASIFVLMPEDHFQYKRMQVYPDHLFMRDIYHTEIGYQVDQSMIAFGSGKLFGKGIGAGTQNHLGFLPVAHTDFIFASIGEELGFLGIVIMLSLFATLLYRSIRVAQLSQDKFGRFMAVGIFGLYFYHFLQNAAMNIGLLPVTGIPMSFVSYGGSHMLIAFAGLGLLQSILLRYKKIKY